MCTPCVSTQKEIDQLKAQVKAKANALQAEKSEKEQLQRKKAEGDAAVESQKVCI